MYCITDRRRLAASEAERQRLLLAGIEAAARCGVDYIELRESDMAPRALLSLARAAMAAVRRAGPVAGAAPTRLILDSRIDIALAAGADGAHLSGDDLPAGDARAIWQGHAGLRSTAHGVFAVTCPSVAAVRMAAAEGADLALFGHLDCESAAGLGLPALAEACSGLTAPSQVEVLDVPRLPVLAFGPVTALQALACRSAGAAGIASTELFDAAGLEFIGRLRVL